jgi:hypothetical protein
MAGPRLVRRTAEATVPFLSLVPSTPVQVLVDALLPDAAHLWLEHILVDSDQFILAVVNSVFTLCSGTPELVAAHQIGERALHIAVALKRPEIYP